MKQQNIVTIYRDKRLKFAPMFFAAVTGTGADKPPST